MGHYLTIEIKTEFGVSNPTVRIPTQIGTASDNPDLDAHTPTAPPSSQSQWNLTEPEPEIQVPTPSMAAPSAPPPDWESDVVVSPIVVPSSNHVQIGAVVESEQDDSDDDNDDNLPAPVVPVPVFVPTTTTAGPTLQGLIDELKVAVSASSVVKQRITDDMWKSQVFSNLSPHQFVSIIRAVSIEFDKAEVAEAVASAIDEFTCEYIVTTIRAVSDWLRITMIQRLLPFAGDLGTNSESILSELSDWEKMSTEKDFETNLSKD